MSLPLSIRLISSQYYNYGIITTSIPPLNPREMKFSISSRHFFTSFALFNPLNGPKNLNYYTNEGKKHLQASPCRILGPVQTWVRILETGHLTCCLSQTEGASWRRRLIRPHERKFLSNTRVREAVLPGRAAVTCGVASVGHHHHLSSGSLKSH